MFYTSESLIIDHHHLVYKPHIRTQPFRDILRTKKMCRDCVLILCLGFLNFSTLKFISGLDEASPSHVVRTKYGLIEGVTKVARNQTQFIAYYGIPYAKAPTGNLRFEPPVPADPWEGILNATIQPPSCSQIPEKTKTYTGQEDCLYLNIYTPLDCRPGSNIPVLFYVFGGEFKYGSTETEGPEFIMNREVILVIVSYRLGVLGFLSTGDAVLPGNMALKDQTVAMKWTKENIYNFGGDPHRITLYGHSSGSMCVHAHTFSPLSKDYFDQVIMQSGFITSPISFWTGDIARSIAHRFAKEVNCTTDTSESLKACLRQKEAEELVTAAEKLFIWNESHQPVIFKPVIEEKHVRNAFLDANPVVATCLSHTKPWLLGMTSGELATSVRGWVTNKDWNFARIYKLWLPIITSLKWTCKLNDLDYILQSAKIRFFKNEAISQSMAMNLTELLTGIMYGRGLIGTVEKYEAVKYLYLYDYRNVGELPDTVFLGIGHSSDLSLIFNRTNGEGIADEDYEFGDEMITRWVNFAHSGNPNVPFTINMSIFSSWLPVSTPRMEFLHIIRNGSMERDYFSEKYNFWKKVPVFSKYV